MNALVAPRRLSLSRDIECKTPSPDPFYHRISCRDKPIYIIHVNAAALGSPVSPRDLLRGTMHPFGKRTQGSSRNDTPVVLLHGRSLALNVKASQSKDMNIKDICVPWRSSGKGIRRQETMPHGLTDIMSHGGAEIYPIRN
jgi:hypothetical protein